MTMAVRMSISHGKFYYLIEMLHIFLHYIFTNFRFFQGSYASLITERPDLFESNRPQGNDFLVESRTAQERWKLLKNVTKWGIAPKPSKPENNSSPLLQSRTLTSNRNSKRNIRRLESGLGGETEISRFKRMRGSRKNSLARTALIRSAENASHHPSENVEVKKSLLSEKFSIVSIDQQRSRGGESFALKRMMSTESTSGDFILQFCFSFLL